MPGRAPPGRAGRVWLVDRIDVARRATELLEQKEQLLRREERRLTEHVARTRREWEEAAADADAWNARADVGGGWDHQRRAAANTAAADVQISWSTQAGVTYPSTAAIALPAPPPFDGTAALQESSARCRVALEAAVRHAAATRALARVGDELAATVRRLRAIRDRWLPRLEGELDVTDLRLDEFEREEIVRLLWSRRRDDENEV